MSCHSLWPVPFRSTLLLPPQIFSKVITFLAPSHSLLQLVITIVAVILSRGVYQGDCNAEELDSDEQ